MFVDAAVLISDISERPLETQSNADRIAFTCSVNMLMSLLCFLLNVQQHIKAKLLLIILFNNNKREFKRSESSATAAAVFVCVQRNVFVFVINYDCTNPTVSCCSIVDSYARVLHSHYITNVVEVGSVSKTRVPQMH